jgi:translation initiation factor 1 (eIF-1/SUI1)
MGNPIVDIKPDREREGRTIFIFETTEKFKNDLSTLLSE